MTFYAAAMPMYGPLEGHMERHGFDDIHCAVLAARAKAQCGHLFAQVEDEDGNVLVDEKDLDSWTPESTRPTAPTCPQCNQKVRVPSGKRLRIKCPSCAATWVQQT
jgi:hypothetical protein